MTLSVRPVSQKLNIGYNFVIPSYFQQQKLLEGDTHVPKNNLPVVNDCVLLETVETNDW